MKKLILLPEEEDYNGAIDALNRIQDTYLLPTSEIRKGLIGEYQSVRSLNG